MIEDGSKEALFSWSFLTLTWNLMCRSKNTVNIHRNHISWENDSLTIQFAHMKTDMMGFEEAVKRHVFANPLIPTICPVLALSVYLAVTPSTNTNGKLFFGSNQYERFRKFLSDIVKNHADDIQAMGIDPHDIGVHSIRKGAATYACSGSTCGPSIAATCNRAGWTMGKVKDTYIQYEAAQDQYLGRILAGLNVQSHEFAVSPPYVISSTPEESILHDMSSVFPFAIATECRLHMKFCLASLLFHKAFLSEKVGNSSRIRTNPILLNRLSEQSVLNLRLTHVTVKFAWEEPEIHLTGIPPHVLLFIDNRLLMNTVQEYHLLQVSKIEAVANDAIAAIRSDLDSRNIGGGQVSLNRFEMMLAPISERIDRLASSMSTNGSTTLISNNNPSVIEQSQLNNSHYMKYQWGQGNKWRRLPEGYEINRKLPPLVIWHLWHHGDDVAPPLKLIDQLDICDSVADSKGKMRPSRDTEVRAFTDLKFLCNELDRVSGIRRGTTPSISSLTDHYQSAEVKEVIPSDTTALSRVRRTDELNWHYIVKVMRQQKRQRHS